MSWNQRLSVARNRHENAILLESLAIGATPLGVFFGSRAFDLGSMLAAIQKAVVSWFEQRDFPDR
jgi:hypothetical protein